MEKSLEVVGDGTVNEKNNAREPRGAFDWCTRRMMASYGREVCFVLAAVFTAYAALHNSPAKTQKASLPKRFFPWNSFVHDYYFGNIQEAFQWVLESDLTFVMFYAPWDAASINTKGEFDKTAKFFHHEVRFLAINCWWPEGECRQHFKPIQAYPVLMAFPGSGQGIQFRGPTNMVHMIRFLENIMQPLKSIFSLQNLYHLQARYDTVVVGYFDFKSSNQPKGFKSFYNTALKIIEKDLSEGICLAITSTSNMAFRLGLKSTKSVKLFRFNESLEFPSDPLFRSEILLEWIFKSHQPIVQWLVPMQVKSLVLSAVIETSNPVLILFTPKNPLGNSGYFELLHEVALDYYNCHQSKQVKTLIQESVNLRKQVQADHQKLKQMCQSWSEEMHSEFTDENESESDDSLIASCCKSYNGSSDANKFSQRSLICIYENSVIEKRKFNSLCSILENFEVDWLKRQRKTVNQLKNNLCFELLPFYSPVLILLICSQTKDISTYKELFSFLPNINNTNLITNQNVYDGYDDKMHSFFEERKKLECRRFHVAKKYSETFFPVHSEDHKIENFIGMGCRTNKTLKFLALDSVQYGVFASNLGINSSQHYHKTAVLLHNTQQEVQHLLKQLLTKHNLIEFIQNYTSGVLTRHLRSSPDAKENCNSTHGKACVQELTGSSFSSVALDETKDVVLLYYAPWCGFCTGIFHIFLTVAQYFQPLHNSLTLARINGDRNDLSWEYTVEEYPTILFFPSMRKAESSVFPRDIPITVANLIYFILANIGESHRLHIALSLCTSTCIAYNRRQIASQLQMLIHDMRVLLSRHHHIHRAIVSTSCDNSPACQLHKENLNYYKFYLRKQIKQMRLKLHHSRLLQFIFLSSNNEISDTHKKAILDNYEIFKSNIWLQSENDEMKQWLNYPKTLIETLKDKPSSRTSRYTALHPS